VEGAAGGGHRRYTPASAGRTTRRSTPWEKATEHPRVGGEDSFVAPQLNRAYGTPPRRRGGRRRHQRDVAVGRNTPASAGRTSSVAPVADGRGGTPPRRRGGRFVKLEPDRLGRNTPASAGRTWTVPWANSKKAE